MSIEDLEDELDSDVPPWEQSDDSNESVSGGSSGSGKALQEFVDMDVVRLPEGGDTPSLYQAVQVKEDFGVEGEDNTFLVLLTTVAGGGGTVCLNGISRSGKDWLMDSVEACLPDNFIEEFPESSTEASLFRRAGVFNRAQAHRHKDIVNLDDHIEDVLKHNGEGKPISRVVSVQDDEGEWRDVEMTIEPPGSLVWFLAKDNEKVDINDYPELRNRSLVLVTDASQELSKQIQNRQARNRGLAYERNLNNDQVRTLMDHTETIPTGEWEYGNDDNPDFYHPYWDEFSDQHPIPTEFVESRMDSDRFWDFVEITTTWNYNQRMSAEVEYHGYEKHRMISTPEDLWIAMRVYGEKLVMSALNLGELDRRILWYLRERKQPHTVSALSQIVQEAGFVVTPRDVRRACDSMANKNYLIKDDSGGNVEFRPTPFAQDVEEFSTLDYSSIINSASEDVYRVLPDTVADYYVDEYCTRPIKVQHPVTGEVHNIEKYDGFERQIEARQKDLKQMLEKSIYEDNPEPTAESDEDSDTREGGSGDDNQQWNFGE